MGQQFDSISDSQAAWIGEQKIFFVGTATADSRVNVSPKGMDSFRVLGPNRVIWLNLTGSGNETAAHVRECPRMTIMLASFEQRSLIMRLYGTAKAVHSRDDAWGELISHFPETPGSRQVFDMQVDLVQTSCGMSMPYYEFVGERHLLNDWAKKQGPEGMADYQRNKNQVSIDGKPTGLLGSD